MRFTLSGRPLDALTGFPGTQGFRPSSDLPRADNMKQSSSRKEDQLGQEALSINLDLTLFV